MAIFDALKMAWKGVPSMGGTLVRLIKCMPKVQQITKPMMI